MKQYQASHILNSVFKKLHDFAEENENQTPFDDDYEKTSSLKYHLLIRGIIKS